MKKFLFYKVICNKNFTTNGIYTLCSICEELNFTPIIESLNLNYQQFIYTGLVNALNEIEKIQPDFIGFSIMFDTFSDTFFKIFLKLIKIKHPNIIIFVGGSTTEFNINRFNIPDIDVVFYGESEYPFEVVLKDWGSVDLSKIPNIAYFKNNKFIINKQTYMDDVTRYNETFKYENKDIPTPGILLSRGCYYECNHCVHASRFKIYKDNDICKTKNEYYRRKTPDQSIKIIIEYCNHFNPNYVYLYDDCIFKKDDWFIEFVNLYVKHINKPLILTGVIQNITPELLDISKKLNIYCLVFGIESANETIRKDILNRHYSNKRIFDVFKLLKKYSNIKYIKTSNLIGVPTETDDTIKETIALNSKLKVSSPNFHTLYPYKYTNIYKTSKKDISGTLYNKGYNDYRSVYKNKTFSDNFIYKFILMKDWFLNLYLEDDCKKIYYHHVEKLLNIDIKDINKNKLLLLNKELNNECTKNNIEHYFCYDFGAMPFLLNKYNNFKTPTFFTHFKQDN